MANRYLVTGVQLGMLSGFFTALCKKYKIKDDDIENSFFEILNEILNQ